MSLAELFRSGLSLSSRQVKAWATVAVALLGAGALLWFGLRGGFAPAQPRWDAAVVVDRVMPVSKLVTVEGAALELLEFDDPVWGSSVLPRKLTGRQFWITQRAKLAMGFDLGGWTAGEQMAQNTVTKTVSLTVPRPALLYVQPDPSSLKIITAAGLFRNGDLTAAEMQLLSVKLDEAFRRSATAEDLERQARMQFESLLQEAARPYGYKVEVTYN